MKWQNNIKCQRQWMSSRKHGFPDRTSHLYIWTHSVCNNMYKAYASSRWNSYMNGWGGNEILPLHEELLTAEIRGISFFNVVIITRATVLKGMAPQPRVCNSTNWRQMSIKPTKCCKFGWYKDAVDLGGDEEWIWPNKLHETFKELIYFKRASHDDPL